jgi:hypothetical protein
MKIVKVTMEYLVNFMNLFSVWISAPTLLIWINLEGEELGEFENMKNNNIVRKKRVLTWKNAELSSAAMVTKKINRTRCSSFCLST